MGILDLFRRADPSDAWEKHQPIDAVLDLRDKSLCGLRFGTPADQLSRFGKPSNKRPYKVEQFDYRESGVSIGITDGTLAYFGLVIVMDEEGISGKPFALILPDGKRIAVNESTSWEELRPSLPAPMKEYRDEDENLHVVPIDACTIEVECGPDDRLRRLNLIFTDSY